MPSGPVYQIALYGAVPPDHVPVMVTDWPLSIGAFAGVIEDMLREVAPASVIAIKVINKTTVMEILYLIQTLLLQIRSILLTVYGIIRV